MKKILGLDLGVSSIGWSVISVDNNGDPSEILGMGSRIVPLSTDDANEFSTGNAISKNQKRTQKRTTRKGYDRYQLRRENLTAELRKHNMLPDEHLIKLPVLELWALRANAATEGHQLSLPEIGRVLYHINQKRGYKHAKADEAGDKKQTDYVAAVNQRFAMIKDLGKTIGQYFAQKLKENEVVTEKGKFYTYRTKEQVYPRAAYIAEFDQIIAVQRKFYPQVLTDEFIHRLRNEIIFYQRNLKSCKHLVSLCEFEKREYKNKEGKIVFDGPKVAPRTSPLFQICRIWEFVNNIRLENGYKEAKELTQDERLKVVDFLDNHEKMTVRDFTKLLGLKKNDEWDLKRYFGKNGVQGNTTKTKLAAAIATIPNASNLLQFNLSFENSNYVNEATGEVLKIVSSDFQNEPLYTLWHTVYSLSDKDELKKALAKKYNIYNDAVIDNLFKLDFVKPGFGNKSAKAIRRILPFLQEGLIYSDACTAAGYNHSGTLTTTENQARALLDRLPQIKRNDLRQPIIEKILNQMVNVVNAIYDEYGQMDEIRIELARELKQSKDERNATTSNNAKRERENKEIEKKILEDLKQVPSRSKIQKYRMWEESGHTCFYCGQPVNAAEFLSGFDVEVEHVIPKSLLFDDSFANKVCACRKCNASKGNKTAYDFMKSKSPEEFDAYLKRVDDFYKDGKISKTKHDRLLTTQSEIPSDFIERQLRQTQYISRKAMEMLKEICYNVYATSGSVTDFIRHTWGYDEILHQLNFDRYKQGGLTEIKEFEHKGEKHSEERIQNWSKRLDHRHHAIDALVIAMTRQSIIQRLNHLNTERDAMFQEVEKQSKEWKNDFSLLQEWVKERKHFSPDDVAQKVSDILISFKAGKRVATFGKRIKYENGKKKVLQTGIVIPRGPLSEESVYGKIKVLDKDKSLKFLFENPQAIADIEIKKAVLNRLSQFENDSKKALQSLKKSPIILKNGKKLEKTNCYKEEYVIKYSLNGFSKNIESVVDKHIKEVLYRRLEEYSYNQKEAFKDIENKPIFADAAHKIQIKNVRCFTGLSAVVPVKQNEKGEPIGFVKPGSNHHIAIYKDEAGNLQESVVTFWHAVERKKYGMPIIITNPAEAWETAKAKDCPEEFTSCLPRNNWTFVQSLQDNEMFIMGLNEESYNKAVAENNYALLSQHLYRVQKKSSCDYYFRHHLETKLDDSASAIKIEKYKRIRSFKAFALENPHKVKVSLLGKLITQE